MTRRSWWNGPIRSPGWPSRVRASLDRPSIRTPPSWSSCAERTRGRRSRPDVPLDDVLPSFHDDGQRAASIVDWSPTVDDPSRQADLRLALTAALDALPEDYRAVVVLRDIEECSIADVAATLGLSVANAKSRVHRARLFLRQRLTVSLATSRESAHERTAPRGRGGGDWRSHVP